MRTTKLKKLMFSKKQLKIAKRAIFGERKTSPNIIRTGAFVAVFIDIDEKAKLVRFTECMDVDRQSNFEDAVEIATVDEKTLVYLSYADGRLDPCASYLSENMQSGSLSAEDIRQHISKDIVELLSGNWPDTELGGRD